MNAHATFATPAAKDAAFWQRIDAEYAAQAITTAEAVIAASAALLVRDPGRRSRIIPGGESMTASEVQLIINRMLPHFDPLSSRGIALRGLLRASKHADFGPEWAREDGR